jgi:hypothetical protein
MAERRALVEADVAAWEALAAPSATADAYEAAVLFLHAGSRVPYRCEIEDHFALIRAEARRELEAQGQAIAAVIVAVIDDLALPYEAHQRALDVAEQELQHQAEDLA